VNRHNVSDAIDSKLPSVVGIIVVTQVQAVQNLRIHGARKTRKYGGCAI